MRHGNCHARIADPRFRARPLAREPEPCLGRRQVDQCRDSPSASVELANRYVSAGGWRAARGLRTACVKTFDNGTGSVAHYLLEVGAV